MQRLAIAAYVIVALTFPAEAFIGQAGTLAAPGGVSQTTVVATPPAPESPAPRG
jgi:hypothetical protein